MRSGRRVAEALRGAGLDVRVLDADAALLPSLATERPDVVVPLLHGQAGEDGAVRADALEDASAATSTLLHPATDGSLIAGSSRQPVLTPEAEEPGVPRAIVRGAIRLVPSLAEARVRSAWWGIRPMTPDERPVVVRLADGLSVATGHGSEGVILGGAHEHRLPGTGIPRHIVD